MDELEKQMYYGAAPVSIKKAKQLRLKLTLSEEILWEKLRGKQICNVRFRRQHPIESFIVDFYCHAAKLVIEIDGKIHLKQQDYDTFRTKEIEKYNICVLRFSNDEVQHNIDNVIQRITTNTKQQLEEKKLKQ